MLSFIDPDLIGLIIKVVGVVAVTVYIASVLKGPTKPHSITWLIWTIILGIILVAQHQENAGPGIWGTIVAFVSCLLVFLLSLKFGEKNITRTDWMIFAGCLLAIIPWILLDDPVWSVVLVTLIDAVAYWPTLRKSWDKPYEESLFYYSFVSVIFALTLLGLTTVNITTAFYHVVILLVNTAFIVLVWMRRAQLKNT